MQKKNGGKIGKYQEGRTINYAGINKDAVENFKLKRGMVIFLD